MTVGENGAEFTQIKKGDIIFNHKQTESLLKNGYVTGRGKAYASGTAYADANSTFASYGFYDSGGYEKYDVNDNVVESWGDLTGSLDAASDAADKFEETLDWIDIRFEELDEELGKLNAQLANATTLTEKNTKIDEIIATNKEKMANADAGADYYENYANKFWDQIPDEFKSAAKNGAIAITDFAGDASEETVEAIEKYREYAQKAADLAQQVEEIKTEISDLAKQKFDNAATDFERQIDANETLCEQTQQRIDIEEGTADVLPYYDDLIGSKQDLMDILQNEKATLQSILDAEVAAGNVEVGSDDWYDMTQAIADLDTEIQQCVLDLEDLALDKFDEAAKKYEGQIDLLEKKNDVLEANAEAMEDQGYEAVNAEYDKIIDNVRDLKESLEDQKKALEKVRDEQVALGNIEVGSEEWYEMESAIADVDAQIVKATEDLEKFAATKLDNITKQFENEQSLPNAEIDQIQAQIDLDEASGDITSSAYYEAMIDSTKALQKSLQDQKQALQSELDAEVAAGNITVGDSTWYEYVNQINSLDTEITNCQTSIEDYQNAINDIHWDNFDNFIKQIEYTEDQTQSLLDLMSDKDMFTTPDTEDGWGASDVEWTDDGLATLGLYAQQMETAKYKAEQYANQIDELKKQYDEGKYSEAEYLAKLNELTTKQNESIQDYKDAKTAIVDLNKARVDAIKEGIQKEIDAYKELTEAKKDELDAEKDLHNFQKSVMDQQKDIADIERQLAALAGDNSAAARAKRAKLEAELAEAKAELEETYYDRSVENQKKALDESAEQFTESKEKESEGWDKYLEDEDAVVEESLGAVEDNTDKIYQLLSDMAKENNLTVDDVLGVWSDAASGSGDSGQSVGDAVSANFDSTKEKLDKDIDEANAEAADMAEYIKNNVNAYDPDTYKKNHKVPDTPKNDNNSKDDDSSKDDSSSKDDKGSDGNSGDSGNNNSNNSSSDKKDEKKQDDTPAPPTRSEQDYYGVALAIWNGNYGWGNGSERTRRLTEKGFDAAKVQRIVDQMRQDGYVTSGAWQGKYHGITDLTKYHFNKFAKGTTELDEDQLAIIDELGEELILHAGPEGRLEYVTKGSGIIPADLTERLMNLAMDPQTMLDSNRPEIAPNQNVINNNTEIHVDASVAELIHVERLDGANLDEISKFVDKAWDKKMQGLNSAIKKYVR